MTGKDLFREIGNIDEKYVTEAEEVKRPVRFTPMMKKSLATVACLCICVGLYFGVRQLNVSVGGETTSNSAADAAGQAAGTQEMMMENSCTMQDSEDYFATADTVAESTTISGDTAEKSTETEEAVAAEPVEDAASKELTGSKDNNVSDGVISESEECRDMRNLEAICERFDGYSDSYEQELSEVDVINQQGVLVHGVNGLNDFLTLVEKGEAVELELLQVTIEGAPIFYYVQYNGEDFYVVKDARRDEFAGEIRVEEAVFQALNVYEQQEEGAASVLWILTEEEEITLEELKQGDYEYLVLIQYVKE